jgi:hypothetical protein
MRWLGRQDSNLGMAESKSDYFSFEINARSEKIAKFAWLSISRLAPNSEWRITLFCPNPSSRINAMTEQPRKYVVQTRGRPFEPGNPGRPKGSRNKATLAMEALLDGEHDALTRKAIDLAKAGDIAALRLCLERLLPPRKDRPVAFEFPQIDSVEAMAAIAAAVADGELTPMEAAELSKVVDAYTRTVETTDLAARLVRLEQAQKK